MTEQIIHRVEAGARQAAAHQDESRLQDESSLRFDYNQLATWPLWLHYTRVLDFYTGDALQADGHFRRFSRHLFVPPNTAAVILLGRNNHRLTLFPGRYHLQTTLNNAWPVSAQFVRLDTLSFAIDDLRVPTRDHLYFELDLWVTMRVTDPQSVTTLREPFDDVKSAFRQRLMKRLRDMEHESAVQTLPTLVEVDIAQEVADEFHHYGLEVHVGLTRMKPDPKWEDLQQRSALVDKDNIVRRREAQREEDVFALQQPGFRRRIVGEINTQLREKNQQARLEAIDSVKELAKALIEDLRLHPGRVYSEKDMQPLIKAIELLDKLAQPVTAPPIPQQVRSYFAIDKDHPQPPPLDWPDDDPQGQP